MTQPAEPLSSALPRKASALSGPQLAAAPLVASSALFAGGKQVRIAHAGQVYLLRITRENKLILTK